MDNQRPPVIPRQRILIVDDSTITIHLLADLLSDMAEVFFVTDGTLAQKKAKELQPALILLDVVMPQIDGYQIGKELKGHPDTAQIPFIFITARSEGEDEEQGLKLGAVDYISKPILPAVVRARVKHQLQLQYMTEQLKQANAELQLLASRDPLTDAFNRRHFLELAGSAHALNRRSHCPLSLVMMDVDNFKQINDRFGHDSGDVALIELVKVCNGVLREVDCLGRIGGEEFAIVLPETTIEGAGHVAERLREAAAELLLSSDSEPFGIT
ncbi:MAG: diguanylate cyclase, partial [Motiliproteus sp.]